MRCFSSWRGLRFLSFLTKNRAGAAALEFSLVAFPFLALISAVLEVGLDLFVFLNLDITTVQAARAIRIGSVQGQNLDAAGFRTYVCSTLPSVLSCNRLLFSVQAIRTSSSNGNNGVVMSANAWVNSVKSPNLGGGNTFCPGGPGDYVVVQIVYAMPMITGIWLSSKVTYNGETIRVLQSNAVIRNEPYGGGLSAGAGC